MSSKSWIVLLPILLPFIQECGSSEVCMKHNPPWGATYQRCDHGCCGTMNDRHCCADSQTLTIVLSLLGGGVGIAIVVAIIWNVSKSKDRSRVEPEGVPVMTQTEAV
ncbi:uncharacterized protein LOC124133887 [Haliotis rufescens]|uniref:uncharacterized protein LOC124133887 n=1 Tax=Haliotis rufescens TaxID=6454 RepID=UPI001EB093CA|nr:uncharacterized protein LOC124133887 [Haliotis rufescens]